MSRTGLVICALTTVGLAMAPLAADAKKYRSARHYGSPMLTSTYGSAGLPAAQPAQPRTYGSSGQAIGTVTAPSIGSYNWPSVGVTNAVPTWSNTNPR